MITMEEAHHHPRDLGVLHVSALARLFPGGIHPLHHLHHPLHLLHRPRPLSRSPDMVRDSLGCSSNQGDHNLVSRRCYCVVP